jgi:hypothetical protein
MAIIKTKEATLHEFMTWYHGETQTTWYDKQEYVDALENICVNDVLLDDLVDSTSYRAIAHTMLYIVLREHRWTTITIVQTELDNVYAYSFAFAGLQFSIDGVNAFIE